MPAARKASGSDSSAPASASCPIRLDPCALRSCHPPARISDPERTVPDLPSSVLIHRDQWTRRNIYSGFRCSAAERSDSCPRLLPHPGLPFSSSAPDPLCRTLPKHLPYVPRRPL